MIDLGKNHHVSFSMHNFLENQSWTITLTRPLSALQSSQCEQRHHHRHKLSGRQIRRFKTRWRFSREDLTQKKKMEKLNLFAKYQRFPVKFSLKPIHTEPKEWPKKQWHCLRWGSGNPSLGPTDVLADGKLRAAPKCEDALKEHSAKNRSVGSSILLFLFVHPSIHGCTSSDFYWIYKSFFVFVFGHQQHPSSQFSQTEHRWRHPLAVSMKAISDRLNAGGLSENRIKKPPNLHQKFGHSRGYTNFRQRLSIDKDIQRLSIETWLTYPSEKWWSTSAGMMTFPIYGKS